MTTKELNHITLVAMASDGKVVRGAGAAAMLSAMTFVYAWRCKSSECYAPDGVRCDCGRSNSGHDPGDEDVQP